MSDSSTPLTVGYWGIRGLGAPLRMMVMYSGAKLKAVNYSGKLTPASTPESLKFDFSSWFGEKPALKELNPLINLPYIIDGDLVISQTNACFTYLGRKFNMLGSNEAEMSQCEQLLCEVMDLRNKMTGFAYGSGACQDTAKSLIQDVIGKNGIFQKFELWLAREKALGRSGIFLVGDRASAPDFHLWEMLHQYTVLALYYKALDSDVLASFPNLAFYREGFASLPANTKYFTSALAGLPFNNKSAKFASTPSWAPFLYDTVSTWDETSGEY